MSLNPQITKQANGTMLMTWTPNLSAFGYRFYRDGVAVSKGTNAAQASTTFAAETDGLAHTYGIAEALEQTAETVTWTPPPAVNPPLFKGDMETVTPPYAPFNVPQAKNYGNPNDTSHASFGFWYRDTTTADTGAASARVDLPATGTAPFERAQTAKKFPLLQNQEMVWSASYRFPADMAGNLCLVGTFSYEALPAPASSPGLALYWRSGQGVEFTVSTGACAATPPVFEFNSQTGAGGIPRLWAYGGGTQQAAAGVWHRFILRLRMAKDKTGKIECWHQKKGDPAWAKTIDQANVATLQYRKSDGFMPAQVEDYAGCYRQKTPGKPVSVWYDNFCRFQTLEDAMGYYG